MMRSATRASVPSRANLTFSAHYAGTCQNCFREFEQGALVKYNRDDELVHRSCPARNDV